jgi:hypothetical protein
MSYLFCYGSVAVSIEYVVEDQGLGAGREAGVRVDVRRLRSIAGHRPSTEGFSFPAMDSGAGIWRADLLVQIDPPTFRPDHHHHPAFSATDVGRRFYVDELTADPVGWTSARLDELASLLVACGAADAVAGLDGEELDRSASLRAAALAECFGRIPGPDEPAWGSACALAPAREF